MKLLILFNEFISSESIKSMLPSQRDTGFLKLLIHLV